MKEIKQLTPQESLRKVRKLLKTKKTITKKDFHIGNILLFQYTAKDKTKPYDRLPFVLVLMENESHMLGLNFHWIPFRMRMWLIHYIIKVNKQNIRDGKRLVFTYRKVKPLLKKLKYAPCIRLYIKKRISKKGVAIPIERMIEIATLKMDMITGIKEEDLYRSLILNQKR